LIIFDAPQYFILLQEEEEAYGMSLPGQPCILHPSKWFHKRKAPVLLVNKTEGAVFHAGVGSI